MSLYENHHEVRLAKGMPVRVDLCEKVEAERGALQRHQGILDVESLREISCCGPLHQRVSKRALPVADAFGHSFTY